MTTIQQLLYESVQLHADRRAIVDPYDESILTYAQLYDCAARIAAYMQARGIQPGERVVIALPRTVAYMIAETACMLFGYGAVLMDAGYPEERIAYACENAGARLRIDEKLMAEMLAYPQQAEYKAVAADCPAMMLYTSGSTGKPKGILHDQASVAGSVLRYRTFLKTSMEDLEGIFSPFTFVVGCMSLLTPLCCGAGVTVIPREIIANPVHLAEFVEKMQITQLFMSPSALKLFKPAGDSLRIVLTGTERVSGLQADHYELYNVYGMSETCCFVTGFPVDGAYANTPIGKAMDGCAVYVLDENGQKVDEGEICVAGHLMSGYVGMPEKTAEVKVPNPFFEQDGYETMIRTGDLGRVDENGNLVFVNRRDWMIKINGQRVEPGEIEAVMKEIPHIANAAVKGFTNASGHSYLCAYYVKNGEIQEDEIRTAIAKRLPQYMMPSYFVELDAMPVNANGKMNRLALLEPDSAQFASEYAAPVNAVQERICNAMANILEIERVGIHDDFFRLGGDSIASMALVAMLDDLQIGTKLLYTGRTPEAIAAALTVMDEDEEETNRLALSVDQPLLPYQTYYLDYQLYSPKLVVTNTPAICSAPRTLVDAQALKQAVDRVTHHFSAFGTVFLFNNAGELVQRYCPERVPEIGIVEATEEEFHHGIKDAFIRPFRMLNNVLWRGQIVVTEENVHLLMDFNHAISGGTTIMRAFEQIFAALQGKELKEDRYYLFLHRYAGFMATEEGAAELDFVRKLYQGSWSKFPKTDFDVRENSNARIVKATDHTAAAIQAAAAKHKVSLGTALVTAGQLALSRFNQEKKVAVEWMYNGRNEKWKEDLIGMTLCGIPATMDFDKFTKRKEILAEARRQNEWGLRYAEHSYALRDMSPAKNECLKIVYEHDIDVASTAPEGFTVELDNDHFTGMLGLFQILIFEAEPDAPLTFVATYQGSRYTEQSGGRMLAEFEQALYELLEL